MTAASDAYVFTVPVPGAEAKDVDVEMADGVLYVTASVRDDEGAGERRMSSSFALPEDADMEKVQATVKNGMLKLRVERREGTRPRKIKVGEVGD